LLRDIPTSIYALKMLRPGTDVSPSPMATPLSSRQNHTFASSYAYTQISWIEARYRNCHTDLCFKTKTLVAHAAKHWTQCHIFPSIQFSHTQLYR